ncbi:hypothetical protein U9M48_032443, partial [Paspalum notatum var. saurae]
DGRSDSHQRTREIEKKENKTRILPTKCDDIKVNKFIYQEFDEVDWSFKNYDTDSSDLESAMESYEIAKDIDAPELIKQINKMLEFYEQTGISSYLHLAKGSTVLLELLERQSLRVEAKMKADPDVDASVEEAYDLAREGGLIFTGALERQSEGGSNIEFSRIEAVRPAIIEVLGREKCSPSSCCHFYGLFLCQLDCPQVAGRSLSELLRNGW